MIPVHAQPKLLGYTEHPFLPCSKPALLWVSEESFRSQDLFAVCLPRFNISSQEPPPSQTGRHWSCEPAPGWRSALWAAGSLAHGWMAVTSGAVPAEMLSLEHTGVPHSSGISLTGTSLRLTVLGKQWHLLRAIAPLIMAAGRNKMVHSPPETVTVFAVFLVLLVIKKLLSVGVFTHVFSLPHFCVPVSRVVTWAGTVEKLPRFPFRWC